MNEGRIEQIGTPSQVFHQPASEFVMHFIGNVNLFHGRVWPGRAVFGSLVLNHAAHEDADGRPARLFVRPYDLVISRQPDSSPSIPARITRIMSAGPQTRIELLSESGETFRAELTHEQFRDLALAPGEQVHASFRDARLFVEQDYAI